MTVVLDERFVPTPGRWQALRSVLGGQKGRGRGERCDLPVFAVGRGGVCGAHRQGSSPGRNRGADAVSQGRLTWGRAVLDGRRGRRSYELNAG